jgi:hypothetical protein
MRSLGHPISAALLGEGAQALGGLGAAPRLGELSAAKSSTEDSGSLPTFITTALVEALASGAQRSICFSTLFQLGIERRRILDQVMRDAEAQRFRGP